MDKEPGIRPVGIGETWRRYFNKFILSVAGLDANKVYVTEQRCGGIVEKKEEVYMQCG